MNNRKNGRWAFIAAWAAVGLALLLLLCCVWQGPDIFYHLFMGKRVLSSGLFQPQDHLLIQQPAYRNIYWLFQIVIYLAWAAGGVLGANLLFIAAWMMIVALWARTAGFWPRSALGPACVLGAILIFQGRFEPRPEVFSYLLLILQVGWLSTWRFGTPGARRRLALFGLTEALWTNIHGYFVFGPALVALRLVAALLKKEDRRATREMALLLAVALAGSFISPFGPGAWGFAVTLARFLARMRQSIIEFLPPTGRFLKLWTVKLFWVAWAGTLAVLILQLLRRRGRVFASLLAVSGLALSAASLRNMPFLPLLCAPIYRAALQAPAPRWIASRGGFWPRTAVLGAGLAAIALAAWTAGGGFHRSLRSDSWFGIGLSDYAYPLRFADYLRQSPFKGRLLNNAADGGFLEFHFPDIPICMDSRYIEPEPVQEYTAALVDPAAFRHLDERLHFEGILLRVMDSGALVQTLLRDPGWEIEWGDLHRVFFKRRIPREQNTEGPSARPPDPLAAVTFYHGEDLSRNINGRSAMQWATLLVQARDRAGFLRFLDEVGAARQVPCYIIQWALDWGLSSRDVAMIQRARWLVPRMLVYVPENRQAVERLLRAASVRFGPGAGE